MNHNQIVVKCVCEIANKVLEDCFVFKSLGTPPMLYGGSFKLGYDHHNCNLYNLAGFKCKITFNEPEPDYISIVCSYSHSTGGRISYATVNMYEPDFICGIVQRIVEYIADYRGFAAFAKIDKLYSNDEVADIVLSLYREISDPVGV